MSYVVAFVFIPSFFRICFVNLFGFFFYLFLVFLGQTKVRDTRGHGYFPLCTSILFWVSSCCSRRRVVQRCKWTGKINNNKHRNTKRKEKLNEIAFLQSYPYPANFVIVLILSFSLSRARGPLRLCVCGWGPQTFPPASSFILLLVLAKFRRTGGMCVCSLLLYGMVWPTGRVDTWGNPALCRRSLLSAPALHLHHQCFGPPLLLRLLLLHGRKQQRNKNTKSKITKNKRGERRAQTRRKLEPHPSLQGRNQYFSTGTGQYSASVPSYRSVQ